MQELVERIPGFEYYRVSNHGCVYSYRFNKIKELRLHIRNDGYIQATIYRDGKPYGFLVHRLVLLAFVGPCPDGYIACHYDGNKSNNVLSNLRWDTEAANARDKFRHGTALVGVDVSPECRAASIKARTGLKHTAEIRKKISDSVKAAKAHHCLLKIRN